MMHVLHSVVIITIIYTLTLSLCNGTPIHKTSVDHFYLLVSFDGFRHDYLEKVKEKGLSTPHFDRLIQHGVRAQHMKPQFPPTTWPQHWTIATGMYVESHGVVSNTFYDPILQDRYDSPNTPDAKWYNNGTGNEGGEPIWVTFEKAGVKTGAAVWPASTTPVGGVLPSYYLPQDNEGINFTARVDAVIDWFTREKDPARLCLLYFDQPDDVGHDFGPDSQEVADKIVELDEVLGYLLDKLNQKQIAGKVNMIIVSDHGMDDKFKEVYKLDEYVDPTLYVLSGETPTLMFLPTEGNEDKLVTALKTVPHSTYYRKDDVPREYFYTYNNRILPHLLLMEDGYRTCCEQGKANKTTVSDHGYNNSHPSQWPFFIAHGPAFKVGVHKAAPVNNTDIYPLLCYLVNLTPHPNNGSLSNIKHILAYEEPLYPKTLESTAKQAAVTISRSVAGLLFMFGIGGFVALMYFTVYKRGKHQPRRSNRTPVDLPVHTPISHPHFSVSTSRRNDDAWLLEKDEGSDDEWTPISINDARTGITLRQQAQSQH